MGFNAFVYVSVAVIVSGLSLAIEDELPPCKPHDFHYEYTECDSEGGRWRVSVPMPNVCKGGAPNPPVRGKGCDFTCEAGEYLDIQGDQECHKCPAGTYSLGGGVRFDDWDAIPSGFAARVESFSGPAYIAGWNTFAGRSNVEDNNCTDVTGWVAAGKYISAKPTQGCRSQLVYTASLVRAGNVRFTYQYSDKNTILHFEIQNSECQTIHDHHGSYNWPVPTKEGEWKTVTASLKSGLNILTWTLYPGKHDAKQGLKKPVMIRSIEITGIAYTSECMKCKAGTMSTKGASVCTECEPGYYSKKGSSECMKCDLDYQYSMKGSSECLDKPLCTADDYYAYNSPCDANNMTQKSYSWIEPKICRDGVQGAVTLPSPEDMELCPPCNPGMELRDKMCQFCPANHYSDGIGPCQPCPGSTAPEKGILYKWWNNLPENANISAYCLSLTDRGCASDSGWQPALDHIHSGTGHADDVYLVLTLKVGGFQGKEQVLNGKAVPLADITFTFSTECTGDCSFVFMTQNNEHGTYIVHTWEGSQSRQAFSSKITDTNPVAFIWAFQKIDMAETEGGYDQPTYNMKDDHAVIYSIKVTNTLQGGATSCKMCPVGANQEGCIPCPPGQIVDSTTNQCTQCPPHTIAKGQSSCEPCGPGLHTTDNVKCETTCKVKSSDGKEYDFSNLAGIQPVEGTRLFTSGGTPYYHLFNISLCGGSLNFPTVSCSDNITYPGEKVANANETMSNITDIDWFLNQVGNEPEQVSSIICRSTIIPPVPGQEDILSTQPVSIGDTLVNITTNGSLLNINARMAEAGFQKDEAGLDVHFVYASDMATSACAEGRTTIITMRCDPTQSGTGTIQLPPHCSDGTCDGCHFHFLWRSKNACPVCKTEDYTEIKRECIDGVQNITYLPPKHCMLMENLEALTKQQPCTVKWPQWLTIIVYGVPVLVIIIIFFIIITIYCCLKNRKLEYKYMKLAASSGAKDGNYDQLPEAETCALEDGEEEEQFDAVEFKENKGGKFLSRLKGLGTKKANFFKNLKASSFTGLTKGFHKTKKYEEIDPDVEELFSEEEEINTETPEKM